MQCQEKLCGLSASVVKLKIEVMEKIIRITSVTEIVIR